MANKPKVVIDTNIFIDGMLGIDQSCVEILDLFDIVKITPLFSQDTIGELVYVSEIMARKSIRGIDKRLEFLNYVMYTFYHSKSINTTLHSEVEEGIELTCSDSDDDMFLECAYWGKANFLISNDKKSNLHSCNLGDCSILTSEEFMNIVNE